MSTTVKIVASTNLAVALEYPFKEKPNAVKPRVLADGSHGPCSPLTAYRDFTATHEALGKRGIKKRYSDDVSGALHLMISSDDLDPDSPDDVERLNNRVLSWCQENAPAHQAVWGVQADGEGGKLHAHLLVNTVSYRDHTEPDGSLRRAGRLFTGQKSNIQNVRKQFDDLSRADGGSVLPTFDLEAHQKKQIRTTNADYWIKKRGGVTQRDRVFAAVSPAMMATQSGDTFDDFINRAQENGVSIEIKRKTRGKDKGKEYGHFTLAGAAHGFNDDSLGAAYAPDQLRASFEGLRREAEQREQDALKLKEEQEAQRVASEARHAPQAVPEEVVSPPEVIPEVVAPAPVAPEPKKPRRNLVREIMARRHGANPVQLPRVADEHAQDYRTPGN